MALTPQEQAELDKLKSEALAVQPKLTPQEQAELEQLKAEAGQPQQQFSPIESFVTGMGQAASLGYLPQIQALTEPIIQKGAEVIFGNPQAQQEEQGYNIQKAPSTYTQRRDIQAQAQEKMAEENPYSYGGGQLAGGISSGVASGGLFGLGRAATLSGRFAQAAKTGAAIGAVRNPGETQGEISPMQPIERAKNAAFDAATGAIFQGGIEGLGKAGQIIKNSSGRLATYAEEKALKAAGAMKKEFTAFYGKNKASELGRAALEEKIIAPGDTVKDIADKARSVQGQIGNNITKIYDDAADYVSRNPFFSTEKIKQDAISAELQNMKNQITKAEAGKRGSAYIRDMGEYVNTSTESTFPDWAANKGMTKKNILESIDAGKGNPYERMVEIAKENLKRGSYSSVTGPEAPNLEFKALDMPGNKLDNIKKVFQEEMSNPLLSQEEITSLQGQMDQLLKNHSTTNLNINIKNLTDEFAAEMKSRQEMTPDGKKIIGTIKQKLENISKNGEVDLKKALEVRQQIDRSAKKAGAWGSGTDPDIAIELKLLRNKLQDAMKDKLGIIDQQSGTNLLERINIENKRYSNMKPIADMAIKKAAGESANRTIGLSEQIAAGAGLATKGPIGAIEAAIASKAVKQYANPVVAVTADKVSKILAKNPKALGAFSAPLLKAAKISPQRLAISVNLALKDPEFAKLIEGEND